ncbi:hypothetical protein ER308_16200 [Egibacter rhizosphaerae]|uniref:SRPBCC family protein n=1 Tax=Egibacter rhizosphaerae TaxID=1670831 RepID=A0A411YIQ8_9ACTN|nr:hypothetical protein ER308_16200 [Egibacter rhizosphaerae]
MPNLTTTPRRPPPSPGVTQTVTASITIPRPPAVVFTIATDPARMARWQEGRSRGPGPGRARPRRRRGLPWRHPGCGQPPHRHSHLRGRDLAVDRGDHRLGAPSPLRVRLDQRSAPAGGRATLRAGRRRVSRRGAAGHRRSVAAARPARRSHRQRGAAAGGGGVGRGPRRPARPRRRRDLSVALVRHRPARVRR